MSKKTGYSLSNGKRYTVSFERNFIKVTEYTQMFDGLFESETDIIWLDNYAEVREYLTNKNGGVEVYG